MEKEDVKKTISFQLDEDTYILLKHLAVGDGRTLSNYIRNKIIFEGVVLNKGCFICQKEYDNETCVCQCGFDNSEINKLKENAKKNFLF